MFQCDVFEGRADIEHSQRRAPLVVTGDFVLTPITNDGILDDTIRITGLGELDPPPIPRGSYSGRSIAVGIAAEIVITITREIYRIAAIADSDEFPFDVNAPVVFQFNNRTGHYTEGGIRFDDDVPIDDVSIRRIPNRIACDFAANLDGLTATRL